jgi:hypothetical protein
MQVTVYPHRGTRPRRRRTQSFPRLEDCWLIDAALNRGQVFPKQRIAGVQWPTAPRIPWSVVWRRSMQRAEKTREVRRGRAFIDEWRDERRFTRQPSRHAPRPGESASRSADTDKVWDGQRQVMREDGEPVLFVLDEWRRCRAAGQANCEILPQTERPVVPPFDGFDERKPGEVGMLLVQQRANERDVNRRFRGWQHRSSVHVPAARSVRYAPAAADTSWGCASGTIAVQLTRKGELRLSHDDGPGAILATSSRESDVEHVCLVLHRLMSKR